MEEDAGLTRVKREPISTLTLSILLGASLAGLGTGTASLLSQSEHYSALREAIDADIDHLETSVSHLQDSLSSPIEIILKNRRGLDLILLQQGGLCFYIDHLELLRDTMANVWEGLKKRKREREANRGWFKPWLTTFISTLTGPLVILLLLLTFRPCTLNRLVQFIKERLGTIQLTVQRSQNYRPLRTEDTYEL